MRPRDLLSVFCASVGPSVNFRQISVHLQVLPSTVCAEAEPSVSIRKLSICQCDLQSAFHAAAGHSVNFRQLSVHPRYLPLTSVQLFVCPWDLPKSFIRPLDRLSTSLNFPCGHGISINFPYNHGTICQLSIRPWDIPSSFFNLWCFRVFILQFRASAESSVNFRQLSVHPRDLSSTFRA